MKRIASLLVIAVLLGGCGAKAEPACRVVTGVQVQYRQAGKTLTRIYTENSSIQSILTYLRILRPVGPVIPEDTQDSTCQIILQYSHGPDSVYQQQGNRYLRRDDGDWENIDNAGGSLLYPLLLLLPSDK